MTPRRVLIVTTMKNEGPFILEWIAHHRFLGVTDFVIYTNDCDDGTDQIVIRLEDLGIAHHVDNNDRGRAAPQRAALRNIRKHPAFKSADWVINLDVDEFLNIRCGSGKLEDLFDAVGPCDAFSICWKQFGNSGQIAFQDGPVTRQFIRCAPEAGFLHYKGSGLKTFFRNNGTFNRLGVHRPRIDPEHARDPDAPYKDVVWKDAAGRAFPAHKIGWRAWRRFGHAHARINHYALRSVDSFLVKRDRGKTNHVGRDQGLDYWSQMGGSVEEDGSIGTYGADVQAELDRLKSDAVLSRLHERACDWHRQKVAELRARPDWQDFIRALEETVRSRGDATRAQRSEALSVDETA